MAHKIETNPDGLKVEVSKVQGKEQKMLEAFQECQEGRCSCPTQEYTKLADMQVEQTGDGKIRLQLKAKEGTELDPAEIERCLSYTEERTKNAG